MTSSWFHCHHPRPSPKLRLFCFPHAGGAPAAFFHWSQRLPNAIEVHAANLPGRERRAQEPLPNDLKQVIEQFSAAVIGRADLPFAFYGQSFGALLAFETARSLRRHGLAPLHFFSAARRAPHAPYPDAARIGHLNSKEFLYRLQEKYGALPAPILKSPAILAHFEPIIRADMRLVESYSYEESLPFDFPITAYGGESDPGVSVNDLEGWRRHTTGESALRLFPGDHFFSQSQLDPLLTDIRQRLESALADQGARSRP